MAMALVTSLEGDAASVLNSLHSGAGSSFGDAFLLLVIPVILVMMLSPALPNALACGAPTQPGLRPERNWVANCPVPWTPDHQENTAGGLECFPVGEAEFASSASS